jgi:O2-independent ubiquinone biosynthesis protein UbiV
VVLSTLTLIEAASELAQQARIVKNNQYKIEANDVAAIYQLSEQQAFIIGPHINVYNGETLALFADKGACRWVVPVELGRETVISIQQQRPTGMEIEVLAFGNLPLAFSARCYTARAHNQPKDSCGFICKNYPDGLPMFTQEKQPFLIINGIQTQSVAKQNLITVLDDLIENGVDIIRIMPQLEGMSEIVETFHHVLQKQMLPENALAALAAFQPFGQCNGYWLNKEGMKWVDNPDEPQKVVNELGIA